MLRISRRTLLAGTIAGFGLAALKPSDLVKAGLLGSLFGQKGLETLPLTPNRDFYITSYDLTPTAPPTNTMDIHAISILATI